MAVLSGYSYAKLEARYPDAGVLIAYFHQSFVLEAPYCLHSHDRRHCDGRQGIWCVRRGPWVCQCKSTLDQCICVGHHHPSCLLNIADAAMVGKAEVVLVGIKLVILALLMLAGTYGMVGHPAVKHVTPHFLSLISSVGLTFFAYAGFGVMTNAAGRVSNPKRTIPRAIYLAIVVVILLYAALSVIGWKRSTADLTQHADTAVALAA